jgi:succinyl-CoA synthetase beta subunit
MKIHEYQAKQLLYAHGVAIPRGELAGTAGEAEQVAAGLVSSGAEGVVVKAQIHAGGRGKGGGVKLARSAEEARGIAEQMLGMTLVTQQTGPEGRLVQRLLIEEALPIAHELYMGIALDRELARPVFLASASGGVEIEATAHQKPTLIHREAIDVAVGFRPFQARKLAFALGLPPKLIAPAVQFMQSLYEAYEESDSSLFEINPCIVTPEGQFYALDAKVNLDDNAALRHPEWKAMRDLSEEDPLEVEASGYGLSYIRLDGNIGCMVNGAGLAMATMDIIKLAGGSPANFLDVGGGANTEQITHAMEILLSDKNVKAVLINIFGGILRVDRLAEGLVAAARATHFSLPLVLRLEGTNVEQGRKILAESGLKYHLAGTMREAAERAVAAAEGGIAR